MYEALHTEKHSHISSNRTSVFVILIGLPARMVYTIKFALAHVICAAAHYVRSNKTTTITIILQHQIGEKTLKSSLAWVKVVRQIGRTFFADALICFMLSRATHTHRSLCVCVCL